MALDPIDNIRDAVEDATSDLRAHNYALVLTAVELMLTGTDPNDAITDIAHKSGEDEEYVRRLTMIAIREALDSRV
jgi:cyanate lyase